MFALGNENFRAPGENRTRDLPNSRSDVLTTKPGTRELVITRSKFHTSRVWHTSKQGAEYVALLCSVSRVASSSIK